MKMPKTNPSSDISKKIDALKKEKGTILIVDDEYDMIKLLETVLSPLGYKILYAQSGNKALKIVEEEAVDIILLDIMLPVISGYEICKILKKNKKTRMIPVLVISALSGVENNIKAMEVGAEGFLSKPFNNQLVIAYVKSLIKVKKLTDELIKVDQLKDDLTRMIIHDLRNPLISALGFLNLSLKESNQEKVKWYSHVIKSGVNDAFNFLEDLHDITRLEKSKLELKRSNENIYFIISELIDVLTPNFEKRGLVTKLVSECDLKYSVDPHIFKRVVQNILTNAAKYAKEDTTVIIHADRKKDKPLTVKISNEGDIIPKEYRLKVFEKFGQVELKKKGKNIGTGLGLAFCKIAIEAHNGRIWVESPASDFKDGTSFIFEIE
jgi:K+-sensing histidine kinase KdpD